MDKTVMENALASMLGPAHPSVETATASQDGEV